MKLKFSIYIFYGIYGISFLRISSVAFRKYSKKRKLKQDLEIKFRNWKYNPIVWHASSLAQTRLPNALNSVEARKSGGSLKLQLLRVARGISKDLKKMLKLEYISRTKAAKEGGPRLPPHFNDFRIEHLLYFLT